MCTVQKKSRHSYSILPLLESHPFVLAQKHHYPHCFPQNPVVVSFVSLGMCRLTIALSLHYLTNNLTVSYGLDPVRVYYTLSGVTDSDIHIQETKWCEESLLRDLSSSECSTNICRMYSHYGLPSADTNLG